MSQHRRPAPRSGVLRSAVLGAAAVLVLAGCSSDGGSGAPPEDVMAEARTQLDETTGVHISLATDELPDGTDGVLEATGVGTHAPAFEGEIKATLNGAPVTVPVVAVGGTVHAKLPLLSRYVPIDPAEYGAPDPARLMATDGGISAWLTEATGVEEGDRTRDGDAVLTSYTGSVPGSAVSAVIPSADRTADFDATFEVDDAGRLVQALVTGPFYGSAGDVSYTVTLSDYGTDEEITAP
jgi:lipoprotein LprG